jgi:ParB/RepB/Spo0J family partition protein
MESQLKQVENVVEIFSDVIIDPTDPMRSDMDRDALYDLANNIKQNGLINPITVRPVHISDDNNLHNGATDNNGSARKTLVRYEVVAGHRRFTACKIAGIIKIPCTVRELTDAQVFSVKAAENLERSDIDPVDEAHFLTKYLQTSGKTVEEIAKQLNRSVGYVEARLELGNMDDHMKDAVKFGGLKLGVANKLAQITDERLRHVWTEMALRDGISVGQAEYWLHGWKVNQLPGGNPNELPPEDYTAGAPKPIRFKCQLSGLEEDARQFRTALIHETMWPAFEAIAREYQRQPAAEEETPVAGEASDGRA